MRPSRNIGRSIQGGVVDAVKLPCELIFPRVATRETARERWFLIANHNNLRDRKEFWYSRSGADSS